MAYPRDKGRGATNRRHSRSSQGPEVSSRTQGPPPSIENERPWVSVEERSLKGNIGLPICKVK